MYARAGPDSDAEINTLVIRFYLAMIYLLDLQKINQRLNKAGGGVVPGQGNT